MFVDIFWILAAICCEFLVILALMLPIEFAMFDTFAAMLSMAIALEDTFAALTAMSSTFADVFSALFVTLLEILKISSLIESNPIIHINS